MIEIPLSHAGSVEGFAKAIEEHRSALLAHQRSVEKPIPVHSPWVEAVISRWPQPGPVAERGPDEFLVLPYKIIDDTARTPEEQQAIDVLRETLR